MTIGTWTRERFKSLTKQAEEIAAELGIPTDEAWRLMQNCNTIKVLEKIERMKESQEARDLAEIRSLAARAATFKANMEGKT